MLELSNPQLIHMRNLINRIVGDREDWRNDIEQ